MPSSRNGTSSTLERPSETRIDVTWGARGYFRYVEAWWQDPYVVARFLNGDVVKALPEQLAPSRHRQGNWPELRLEDEAYIDVPTSGEFPIEISPFVFREVTDPAFAEYSRFVFTAREEGFGKRLRAMRIERRIPAQTLAHAVSIHPQNLSRIERGKSEPGIWTVAKILKALGASWAELDVVGASDRADDHNDPESRRSPLTSPLPAGARNQGNQRAASR